MDQRQFDNFARLLARRGNRRSSIRGGLLAAAVAFAARCSARAQDACAGGCFDDQTCVAGACLTPCQTHRDCRSKKKDDPCVLNTCVDGYCVEAIADCQTGFECCRGECCAKACVEDAECAVVDLCRIGRCGEGVCVFEMLDPCVTCGGDEDCATGGPDTVCCDGMCKRPCPVGTMMGKGCECRADSSGTANGLIVHDDASG